jgi:DNA-binding CsgD family transcriptional regulator
MAWGLHELAVIIADDDRQTAAEMLAESLGIHAALGDRWRIASVIETIAALAAASGQVSAGDAAALLGGASALRNELGTPVPPAERAARDRCARTLRDRLGTRDFRAAWRRDESLGLGDLIDAALRCARAVRESAPPPEPLASITLSGAGQEGAGQGGAGPGGGYGLTDRETEVLRLLTEGLTNREIGKRLLISTGTTGAHVSNILRKLGVSSRVQAVGIAHRLGLGEPRANQ